MKRSVLPLRGPELLAAINGVIAPSIRRGEDGILEILPLKFLAKRVYNGSGFVEISVESVTSDSVTPYGG